STTPTYTLSLHDALPISMRLHHVAAARDIADQQDHQNAIENERSRRCLGTKIEKAVDKISCVAANQYCPAAGVGHVTIDDGKKRSEEHTSELQSPYDLVC